MDEKGLEFVEDVVDVGWWELCGFSFAMGVELARPIRLEAVKECDAVLRVGEDGASARGAHLLQVSLGGVSHRLQP